MYMFKYVMKRIGLMLLTFIIIVTICFFLIKSLPVVPSNNFGDDKEWIEYRREKLGYNKPIIEQYFIYWRAVLTEGDFGVGEQIHRSKEVWDTFMKKLPATMLVNLYAMIFSVPLGIMLGIYAALKKNKWQDHVISTGVMIFVSVPSYIYAFLVQYILCFKLREWLPSGWGFPFEVGIMEKGNYFTWDMFVSLIPAVLSLSFGSIAGYTRYVRAELTEVLTSEFMLLARTKGLTRGQATVRHALKNTMVVVFPMILGEFIGILGGSLVIENIFTIPGVGGLYLEAINGSGGNPDYNFFMLLSMFYTFIGLAAGIISDISMGLVDPRIRMGAR